MRLFARSSIHHNGDGAGGTKGRMMHTVSSICLIMNAIARSTSRHVVGQSSDCALFWAPTLFSTMFSSACFLLGLFLLSCFGAILVNLPRRLVISLVYVHLVLRFLFPRSIC